MKSKSKKNTNYGYLNMSDEELSLFINSNVENYLKLKKSCEIAKSLLKENCHDFFVTLSTTQEDSDYSRFLQLAELRNINVLYTYDNVVCKVEDVVPVLNAMCTLELSWLDEHRYIFDENPGAGSYFEEEENTIKFYRGLIKNLSNEQISVASEPYYECILSLY